jgi:hypothetical protein
MVGKVRSFKQTAPDFVRHGISLNKKYKSRDEFMYQICNASNHLSTTDNNRWRSFMLVRNVTLSLKQAD